MKTCRQASALVRKPKKNSGQAVIEYVLLMAVIFISSTVLISFIRNGLFAAGLKELPQKVSVCLSQRSSASFGGASCQ